jgi:hypothetical protein
MATPITLEMVQYMDRPMGKLKEKNPSIIGIIQSIILWLDCCLGSAVGDMVIFVCTQVEAATARGMIKSDGPGLAPRSIPKNLLLRGAAA